MRAIPFRMLNSLAFAFCILAEVCVPAQTKVSGRVYDQRGAPLAQAFVGAFPIGLDRSKGVLGDRPDPWIQVDGAGRFAFTLAPGHYKIQAKDEPLGYPDPLYWLNADPSAVFPELIVEHREKEIRGVRVVLGRRGGMLSGELIDRRSRSPIVGGKIILGDAQNANAFVEVFSKANGHFEFAVPSKPITISISAAGYKANKSASGAELTLAPGEHREIVFELQRQ